MGKGEIQIITFWNRKELISVSDLRQYSDARRLLTAKGIRNSTKMGGGIGRLREVCGAFSGMAMTAGLLYGFLIPPEQGEKSEHYKRIQFLSSRFSERWGSIVCRDILAARVGESAVDTVPVPEERTKEYYSKRPCLEAVRLAARILDEYIENNPIK